METENTGPSKKELLEILQELINNMENLPPHALVMPITHYDQWQLMILILQIFKQDQTKSG